MIIPRTDLAYERHRAAKELGGYRYKEEERGICRIHTMHVDSPATAQVMSCEEGTYQTLFFPVIASLGEDDLQDITRCLSSLLLDMADAMLKSKKIAGRRILVVCLGNRHMTADAIGPLVADKIWPTAHLRREEPALLSRLECADIAVLSPGVAAQSGLESQEWAIAVTEKFHPDLVVAVDALAARSTERLATTIQLSNTGIAPGSGVKAHSTALNQTTLGCPVLSIGAPTVIDTASLVYNVLEKIHIDINDRERTDLENMAGVHFVTLQNADIVCQRYATVIGNAINRAWGVPLCPF